MRRMVTFGRRTEIGLTTKGPRKDIVEFAFNRLTQLPSRAFLWPKVKGSLRTWRTLLVELIHISLLGSIILLGCDA